MITFAQFLELTLILFLIFLVIDNHLQTPTAQPSASLCVVLSEHMTITSAMQAAAALGWKLKRRGREIYLFDGFQFRHSAVLVGV